MAKSHRVIVRALALGLTLACMAAACGDDSSSNAGGSTGASASSASSAAGATTTTAAPKVGGSLSMAMFSETGGLDPAVGGSTGTTGSTEMAAIYDTIMRFDTDAGKYVPQTAESMTPNADFSEWTLKLKPNIKFSDGTDYDAAAVESGIKRHVAQRSRALAFVQLIAKTEVVDKLTVKFTLTSPWSNFPYVLTVAPGMVPSPAAVAKCDATKPANTCEFNLKPVGAGPFVIDGQFNKGEPISLKRNTTYWGGQVYLDSIKFVQFPLGSAPAYDAMKTGTVKVGFLREPAIVKKVQAEKLIGGSFVAMQWMGGLILMNNGKVVCNAAGGPTSACQGQAAGTVVSLQKTPITADKRIRQAVAYAIDPAVMNQRTQDGQGFPGTEWFQQGSKWGPSPVKTGYDLAKAKALVAQVKAEGKWDGTIRTNCAAARSNWSQAVKSLLEAAGFTVAGKDSADTNALVADVIVNKDYDIACWGFPMPEEEPYVGLSLALLSTSSVNALNLVNPAIDAQTKAFREAKNDTERKAALDALQKVWVDEVPGAVYESVPEMIAWNKDVHGVRVSSVTTVLFDKAWIG